LLYLSAHQKIPNSNISSTIFFFEMKSSKSFGIIAIAAVAVMLIASAAAAVQEDAFAGKKKKYVQSLSQANDCGNGLLPLNVYCQNLAAQIQGDGNAMNIIGAQS
jgi:uncharacterized membrane protein